MSLTIRDCLQLPSLSLGKVIAGHNGLDNIVNTVSVVEFHQYDESFYTPNELLISAFYSIKDNVSAQCIAIEEYKKSGDVGLVLFYFNLILKEISPQVIEVANKLNFPIIAIPAENIGIKYSDVISDVMEAIFVARKASNFFVKNTMERLSQLSESNRTITTVLSFASEYAKSTFFLCDDKNNVIATAYWPTTYTVDFETVLDSEKMLSEYNVYTIPFTNNSSTNLKLYGVSKNSKLDTRIMNEVIEVIQLFAVIWNYNLNTSTKEALIPAIFENDIKLMETICAKQLLDLSHFNCIFIIDLDIEKSNIAFKKQMVENIRQMFSQSNHIGIIDLFGDLIVVLGSYSKNIARDEILLTDIISYLATVDTPLYHTFFTNIDISAGTQEIYLKYCNNINIAKLIYPTKTNFTYSEIDFADKCKKIFTSINSQKEKYYKILNPIIQDPEEDLVLTLSTYLLDAESEVKKTSELLFIHRNTVQYRLAKVKNLINVDFSKMPMSYEVYFAVALLRIEQAYKL